MKVTKNYFLNPEIKKPISIFKKRLYEDQESSSNKLNCFSFKKPRIKLLSMILVGAILLFSNIPFKNGNLFTNLHSLNSNSSTLCENEFRKKIELIFIPFIDNIENKQIIVYKDSSYKIDSDLAVYFRITTRFSYRQCNQIIEYSLKNVACILLKINIDKTDKGQESIRISNIFYNIMGKPILIEMIKVNVDDIVNEIIHQYNQLKNQNQQEKENLLFIWNTLQEFLENHHLITTQEEFGSLLNKLFISQRISQLENAKQKEHRKKMQSIFIPFIFENENSKITTYKQSNFITRSIKIDEDLAVYVHLKRIMEQFVEYHPFKIPKGRSVLIINIDKTSKGQKIIRITDRRYDMRSYFTSAKIAKVNVDDIVNEIIHQYNQLKNQKEKENLLFIWNTLQEFLENHHLITTQEEFSTLLNNFSNQ